MGATSAGGYPPGVGSTVEVGEIESLAKGALIVGDGSGAPTTLTVGANDTILMADSAQASGTKWGNAATVKTALSLDNVENTALSTWAGTANITTVGTIATGTWSATAIGATKGGTGQTTYAVGDVLYCGVADTLSKLAGNTTTTRNFLRQVGDGAASAAPAWDTVTKTDVGLSNVENTALSTWAGSANITTVGTIGSGTWQGAAIGDSYISSAATWNAKQAGHANLTSLAALNYVSASFVKMTAADTFALDTNTYVVSGGALGTPSSGTLTNCTGLPITGLATSTVDPIGVGSIELGHASDTTITRTGAGAIAVEGVAVLLSGGALGTPASGTLTSCTGLPIAGLVASTSTAIGVGSVELGHASDTTIARVSAGVISVEGVTVPTISSTNTLTNKRIDPRITSIVSEATPTVNTDNCDAVTITAQAAAITSMTTNLSGTPVNFQKLIYRIKDDGTGRAITWGASFEAKGTALPTTTVASKVLTVGFIYDTVTSKWGCVASQQEA